MDDAALLKVAIQHRLGPLALDVSFELSAGWTVLFGASGSGKSTLLRAIQGLVRPATATILLSGDVLVDTAERIFVPPHQRGVRSAAQTPRLFPGKTIQQNITFGAQAPIAVEVLELFRLDTLAHAAPDRLSGGERQRASVARAVASAATSRSLLLLDEPFTGLDLSLRDTLAIDLRAWLHHRHIPVLSVTHDVGEVFLLKAEVLRLQDGRITHQGPAAQVLSAERDRLLAQLQG